MAMPVKLSQKTVDAMPTPAKTTFVFDTSMPGFGVRLTPSGLKVWVAQTKAGGKTRRTVLGSVSDVRYADARQLAEASLRGDVTTGNSVPDDEVWSFADAWEDLRALKAPRWSPATIEDYDDRMGRHVLPILGDRSLDAIREPDVERLCNAHAKTPRTAAYLATLIKAVFNHAIKSGRLPEGHRNPARGVTPKARRKLPKALHADEITRIGVALGEMEREGSISPWLAGLFRLSLILGLRPGEVQTLTWDRVDLVRKELTVIGKTGTRVLHMPEAAVQVLGQIPKVEGVGWVFVGRRHGQHIVAPHKQLARLAERAGVVRFNPYAFRHSAATGALLMGADIRSVQDLLGHTDLKTTALYLQVLDGMTQGAAEKAAAYASAITRPLPSGEREP